MPHVCVHMRCRWNASRRARAHVAKTPCASMSLSHSAQARAGMDSGIVCANSTAPSGTRAQGEVRPCETHAERVQITTLIVKPPGSENLHVSLARIP